jgi:diacylglycerol kinase (ATP)
MPAPHSFTLAGRFRSLLCACRGIRVMLTTQQNAWIHLGATCAVVVAAVVLRVSATESCLLTLAMMAVWTAEALNTAFEFLTDVASPSFHPLAEKAKDVAAGAVLITAIGAVVVGLIVFGPHLWS